jgi:hypothetical protein
MTAAVDDAKSEATALVEAQTGMPAQVKTQALTTLEERSAAALAGGTGGGEIVEADETALAGAFPEGAGVQQTAGLESVKAQVQDIYKQQIGDAFRLPFLVAAVAAFLILLPAMFTGRRLGAHSGAHGRSPAPRSDGRDDRSPCPDAAGT